MSDRRSKKSRPEMIARAENMMQTSDLSVENIFGLLPGLYPAEKRVIRARWKKVHGEPKKGPRKVRLTAEQRQEFKLTLERNDQTMTLSGDLPHLGDELRRLEKMFQ